VSKIKDRPRPCAAAADPEYMGKFAVIYGRTVILFTGRGDVPITPAEARTLAAELIAAAKEAEARTPQAR
jgi:hypothetical protein